MGVDGDSQDVMRLEAEMVLSYYIRHTLLKSPVPGGGAMEALIELFNLHEIRYLVIGGQAVRLEGFPRFSMGGQDEAGGSRCRMFTVDFGERERPPF